MLYITWCNRYTGSLDRVFCCCKSSKVYIKLRSIFKRKFLLNQVSSYLCVIKQRAYPVRLFIYLFIIYYYNLVKVKARDSNNPVMGYSIIIQVRLTSLWSIVPPGRCCPIDSSYVPIRSIWALFHSFSPKILLGGRCP